MARNYIMEARGLGVRVSDIAEKMGVSKSTVYRYSKGLSMPNYESARNVYRRASYRFLREHHLTSSEAVKHRRKIPGEVMAKGEEWGDWVNEIVDRLDVSWNKKHPDPKDPKHMSRDEIRRRVIKGMSKGHDPENWDLS